jgi:sigma-B regulation protein RsbU (phosphoserine phosphatase)
MIRDKSLAFKLTLFTALGCLAIFAVSFGYDHLFSKEIIEDKIEENARTLAGTTINKIEGVLNAVEKIPDNLARFIENTHLSESGLRAILETVVRHNHEIIGSAAAFEPFALDGKSRFRSFYYYRRGTDLLKVITTDGSYNYLADEWYRAPRKLKRSLWSEPYFDEHGARILMSTYSAPFYQRAGGGRKLLGIVTADISLEDLQGIVSSIRIARTGYAFLISRNGTFITHPREKLIMKESIFSVADKLHDAALRDVGLRMVSGGTGFIRHMEINLGQEAWLMYTPLESSGWSLGVVFPRDEMLADIVRLDRIVWSIGALGLVLLCAVIAAVAGSLTRPLADLAKTIDHIAKGNLDSQIAAPGPKDEVGRLAENFIRMRGSLKKYIADLTAATAAKERIESELEIARGIQLGMVPKKFPAFPGRPEFDLHAVLRPAREVGGDLYDFFMLDERRLCLVIGDISGKGVPAALLMTTLKVLIKVMAAEIPSPEMIIERVNRAFCTDNEASMFATVFLGILDVETGVMEYTNAGHNPPMLIEEAGVTPVPFTDSPAVGLEEDSRFHKGSIMMRKGDLIFLYTDGVTEAFNVENEQFTEERLQDVLGHLRADTPEEAVNEVLNLVSEFSRGREQSDDITILVVAYRGAGLRSIPAALT